MMMDCFIDKMQSILIISFILFAFTFFLKGIQMPSTYVETSLWSCIVAYCCAYVYKSWVLKPNKKQAYHRALWLPWIQSWCLWDDNLFPVDI